MIRSGALVLVVLWLVLLGAPSRVRFIGVPSFVSAGQSVFFSVWVEPEGGDRILIAAALEPECVGRIDECSVAMSLFQLGDGNRKLWDVRWVELPHGEFVLVAVVFDSQREVARAISRVQVMERF